MKKEVVVPDIGSFSNVPIIEMCVKEGDVVVPEAPLIVLETDKATMEIPAPFAGTVAKLQVKVGDTVSQGHVILLLETESTDQKTATPATTSSSTSTAEKPSLPSGKNETRPSERSDATDVMVEEGMVYASPGVRRFAREMGVDLQGVPGTGRKGRLSKEDVQSKVKKTLDNIASGGGGFSLPKPPKVNFAEFGEVEYQPLSRIKKLSGSFLHRNWVNIPHVTQFDEADITEMEAFRKENQSVAEKQGLKLTPVVFLLKAVASALQEYPNFNASLDETGQQLVLKKYCHIGVAVDTPQGLVVPVVRDVDKKGLLQLAKDIGELSAKARSGQLTAKEMQGGCFTISSLGGLGGTCFTPIINAPEVAILGISKAQMRPIYQKKEDKSDHFVPRLMLPLSLSYDHRVIDGAEGIRFLSAIVKHLCDIQQLSL